MDQSFDIDPIVTKYIRNEELTPGEAALLRDWLARGKGRQELLDRLRNDPDWTKQNLIRMQDLPNDRIWARLVSRLRAEGYWRETDSLALPVVPRRTTGIRPWRFVAAASVIVLAAAGAFRALHNKTAPAVIATTSAHATEIQPGGDKATLTLADGKIISLDSSADGVLTSQGNTLVAKLNGHLAYNKAASEKPLAPTYNVLTTPRAGQFTLSLPDGTNVWLNNASSLRYPVWFTGAAREVELDGEAYFEVAKDAAHPFRVHIKDGVAGADGATVDVLGTSFNIMAYNDENSERATLVDGSIRFTHGNNSAVLKPAEQSILTAHGDLKTLRNVDVDEITAWKNGYFHFAHTNLQSTMRQLARWYDVTVVYEGDIAPQEFEGKIERTMTLNKVLKGMEGEHLHFKLEGNKVTVTP
jgi:transmembrane sensor